MSLPQRLATTLETIPAQVPYLTVAPATDAVWRQRFAASAARFKLGLVWSGDPRVDDVEARRIDRRRSMALDSLAPLLELEGIEYHSLQTGAAAAQLGNSRWHERIVDWSGKLADFAETGALIRQLDLVISVDTAVVHLAGALGKPVWLLSRYDGCWRWLLERDDSPWYPTLRLFRQLQPGSWQAVVAAVRDALLLWRDQQGR